MKPFYARHYRLILLLIVFLLPFVSRGTRMAIEGNNNDIKDWLPPDYPESAAVKWFQRHFPGDQFALISWDGCTLGDTRKLDLLARKLVARDPRARRTERTRLFSRVITGPGMLAEMTSPPLALDYGEAIARLEGSLIGPAPAGAGDDGRATCLMVTLSDEGKRTNRNKRRALEEIKRAAAECAIPAPTLHMGGPPVDNVAIDEEKYRPDGFVEYFWNFLRSSLGMAIPPPCEEKKTKNRDCLKISCVQLVSSYLATLMPVLHFRNWNLITENSS